jgi:inhibitor of KinA
VRAARVVPAGDAALIVEWDTHDQPVEPDDPGENVVNDNIDAVALATALEDAAVAGVLNGVLDIVPTFRTVAVYFDPLKTDVAALSMHLEEAAARPSARRPAAGVLYRVPVCYGGSLGPDLADVAVATGLTEDAVVARHAAPTYRVFMLGFMPGFAYMGPVDTAIAVPRRTTPRVRVAAGSIGLAGTQTGIYPSESPGGWQVIGRTPVRPFDPDRAEPFLFKAGDRVQFYPIDEAACVDGHECLPST